MRYLHVTFQIDVLKYLNFETDSTLLLMKEACRRGYKVFFYFPQNLTFYNGELIAQGYYAHFNGDYLDLNLNKEYFNLKKTDIIFIRQNPPFDMTYLSTTYLLDFLSKKIILINQPQAIRDNPEKILVNHFLDLIPPTLISRDSKVIKKFIDKHKRIILKPLYSFGSRGVLSLQNDDHDLMAILNIFLEQTKEPLVIQKFLPEIFQGDVRIFLVDGEFLGGFRRVPKNGDFRSNLIVGGMSTSYVLNNRDKEICKKIGPILKAKGLFFVGIDIIGKFLIEINTTSPTGINALNKINQEKLELKIWNIIENKI